MREGFTTGTAATAAAIGALILKKTGKKIKSVKVSLPMGDTIDIPVSFTDEKCVVVKDAGDDPDITNGIEIIAKAEVLKGKKGVEVKAGKGIGIVKKKGLQVEVGKPAINPVPMRMIKSNVEKFLEDNEFAVITIEVPKGEEIAKNTFNERLGIVGGISILGTTGIVKPMSLDALIASIKCEIDVILAEGKKYFFLVPGKIGERHIKSVKGDIPVVQVSNYFKDIFDYLANKGIKRFGIAGHPGKIAKISMGYYNTHSKHSPQANGFVCNLLGLKKNFNTIEEICKVYRLDKVASAVKDRIKKDYGFDVDVILFDMEGNIVGEA
ncbi:cobalt-precorrin-5B (C(1))-methyltransferase CbiD [Hippea alviniae]|uniref:cobalt-precorrin-5B (C(1))-methyltransferase CbiD n=1 Tax=Hippea alviniae TaxID=1279027 RepID=UPI0003B3844C|nr:cobalt-precorrin-5B (C(1))-methyltransferase CbiD [Hippea alviniae]